MGTGAKDGMQRQSHGKKQRVCKTHDCDFDPIWVIPAQSPYTCNNGMSWRIMRLHNIGLIALAILIAFALDKFVLSRVSPNTIYALAFFNIFKPLISSVMSAGMWLFVNLIVISFC